MADGLNKVMIIGNLGADPEMSYTANGNAVTKFRVAVSRKYRSPDGESHEQTEWFRVVAWNRTAEFVSQYVAKGRKVYVEGRLQTHSWDGQDGQKRYMTEVIANQVITLDRREGAPYQEDSGGEGAGEVDPDDLPFNQ